LVGERRHKRWPVAGTRGKPYRELQAIAKRMNFNRDGERFFVG
jgi:hypothetical protein